jgi:acetyl esterase
MPLPLKLRTLLWVNRLQGKLDLKKITPDKFRKYNLEQHRKLGSLVDYKPEKMFSVKDWTIKSSTHEIPIRIYQPSEGDNFPVLMYFHGGGFVIGNIETHDTTCRRLAKMIHCIVVSVDYRLAPEHKFPAAPEDCYAATLWVSENAQTFHGDGNRIAVIGDSAGGNLATVVCLMARDRFKPRILYQVLIYPVTDSTFSGESIKRNSEGYLLTEDMMRWFLDHYIHPETDLLHPYLAPIWAEDLSNLPPALIITAGFDPLQSEGMLYAKKLQDAGNSVRYIDYENMIHVFFQMPRFLKTSREAFKNIAQELKVVFGTNGVIG